MNKVYGVPMYKVYGVPMKKVYGVPMYKESQKKWRKRYQSKIVFKRVNKKDIMTPAWMLVLPTKYEL